ncbi:reverse transcriptase domain-containing protein [Pseudomonas protegens]|uniref:reverse transcriptase domain-containing protein n=1 Tax=Pseudomonas protegens TaxID=380021 RepID=UPI002936D859|nr:reverse transcriptase domain-containing protein [Pseudomonas protegens]WOE82151.1 reverse transcriptase domain-containing protein [Pseudomonas protegens]
MLKKTATLLHNLLATDQSYHAQQQPDGKYKKRAGAVSIKFIEQILKNKESFAIYQKNTDLSIKWICFDFDISKANLESRNREAAQKELERSVKLFCQSLDSLNIPYLLEFSGNRGFHIWITFETRTSYRTGYEIQQALIEFSELDFNQELISIDFFPNSSTPTDGVGLGVKSPLSKHTKSNQYAYLLKEPAQIDNIKKITELSEELLNENIEILRSHKNTSKSEIETALGVFFDIVHDETFRPTRIKSIKIQKNGFDLAELLEHWKNHPPLQVLSEKLHNGEKLNHEERKLLVGVFCNITAKNIENTGTTILQQIFSNTENYDPEITNRSIKKLSSFNFPSQEQIEKATRVKFRTHLSTEELVAACIPKLIEFEDATFEISRSDIEITKSAELTYLFLNDEAQSKLVINELSSDDSYRLLELTKKIIEEPKTAKFYRHIRNEKNKSRILITLNAAERIATSCILKQLIYFLNLQPSSNSHGYRPNKGFSGGYIFQPWLYLWIKFVSNISAAIEDRDNQEYYIVKTDIKSFYDSIPHDNLKRMLLGGANSRIDAKLSTLPSHSKLLYEKYIDSLFEITEKTTASKIGLPQGPAYARYLAELYLDNLDQIFDIKIQQNELQLYQRYVDDIFFIAPSEEIARSALNNLREQLATLGLEINNEKTVTTKIKNFSEDFNIYRSQSKYAVDQVSKNFADSTDTQKNLAVTEFMNLVQSDSCNDDLAFIFSHLAGVPQLDAWKREKVEPTLKSQIGRGSLYKHLFNFVLDSRENWGELEKTNKYDELQSEVLTACFITSLESGNSSTPQLKALIQKQQNKLSRTELTNENLACLALIFDIDIDLRSVPSLTIINFLRSVSNIESINITTNLIEQLNTNLNDIKSLPDFIEALYPLCASPKTNKSDLNNLAITFYAKLSTDFANDRFSSTTPPEISNPSTASKYYFLLCLFSISDKNQSLPILTNAWKYCAHIFNTCDTEIVYNAPDWFRKINDIEYSEEKALVIISAIVDGNIFRGLNDKRKVFEKFHNLLLIYITFQNNNIKSLEIEKALSELKSKALFYQWLIENKETSLFPETNKLWFEKNIIENGSIVLKRGNSILFRKPTNSFHHLSEPQNEHNGYSEIIIDYTPSIFKTVADTLSDQTVSQKLKYLLDTLNFCKNSDTYPNIFCRDRILKEGTLLPFSNELMNSRALIFENKDESIETLTNNKNNFIKSYLRSASSDKNSLLPFKEKYIDNLDESIEIISFIKQLSFQLEDIIEHHDSSFHFDIAAAAALYLCIIESDTVRKIDKFVSQYHKFNQDDRDRHIYAIDQDTIILDETPLQLLNTIETSLRLIPMKVTPALALYIHKDIEQYKNRLCNLVAPQNSDDPELDIKQFKRIFPRISPLNESLHTNGKEYKFQDIKLINLTTNEIHQFEARHSVTISSSEHIYFLETSSEIYITAIHSSISKIYDSLHKRSEPLATNNSFRKSYPLTTFDEETISSLNNFNTATEVISLHRDISKSDAQKKLKKWLGALPKKFHQILTSLISAHVVMKKEQITSFTRKVEELLQDKSSNPFLIKKIADYNGTHRILYKYTNIGRSIDGLSPLNINEDAEKATIIVDNIITGSQIISSISFYSSGIESRSNSNNFEIPKNERASLEKKLKTLKSIDICTILYTQSAIDNIKIELRKLLNPEITINVICGSNIGNDAFFESTCKIGESEKSTIRETLKNSEAMQDLYDHLEHPAGSKRATTLTDIEINKTNLIARYQSLPKKCFSFLRASLRHDSTSSPLIRVLELNEK